VRILPFPSTLFKFYSTIRKANSESQKDTIDIKVTRIIHIKQLCRLLGMTSWYRRFIPQFATLSEPLTRPLKKFVLQTDASSVGLGAVLTQTIKGEERVITFASSSLSRSKKKIFGYWARMSSGCLGQRLSRETMRRSE